MLFEHYKVSRSTPQLFEGELEKRELFGKEFTPCFQAGRVPIRCAGRGTSVPLMHICTAHSLEAGMDFRRVQTFLWATKVLGQYQSTRL
jgi:hypothetical protein